MELLVDGNTYTTLSQEFVDSEWICVFDADDTIVGRAVINHNTESISVTYNDGGIGEVVGSTSFPFYEFKNEEEMARWIVCTHPING